MSASNNSGESSQIFCRAPNAPCEKNFDDDQMDKNKYLNTLYMHAPQVRSVTRPDMKDFLTSQSENQVIESGTYSTHPHFTHTTCSNVTPKRLDKGGVNVSTSPHFLRTTFHSERRLKQLGQTSVHQSSFWHNIKQTFSWRCGPTFS